MQKSTDHTAQNWWAAGDFPARTDSRVSFLIDGRHTMWTMCLHFLQARHTIHLAHWGLTPQMKMVRGTDQRAGEDGSPEQDALVAKLREAGLGDGEVAFWTTQELTIQNVLGFAVKKGVDVKVQLWACPELFSHYSPKTAHEELTAVGVHCILDDSANRPPHLTESLHQKCSIVDGELAFVGGIDPLIELSGDYDRWDTPWHHFISSLRKNPQGPVPHTWHDVHSMISGTAARDVEYNFYQRWNELVGRHKLSQSLLPEPVRTRGQMQADWQVQIARTIPPETYQFATKDGIQGIAQLYASALSKAQQFLYIENQYFWLHTFLGISLGEFGPDNPQMEHNLRLLAEALEHGASLMMILPDHPNVGREFTDRGLEHLRKLAPSAHAAGRIQIFTLATSTLQEDHEEYSPVYVHAKVAIVDDCWSTIGSANLNNRGMRDDAELNVGVHNAAFAHDLRVMLWAEHLGLIEEEEQFLLSQHLSRQPLPTAATQRATELWVHLLEQLDDPAAGLRLLNEAALANLQRFKDGQPLQGHLIPYLTVSEAHHLGLELHESHGLFETPQEK